MDKSNAMTCDERIRRGQPIIYDAMNVNCNSKKSVANRNHVIFPPPWTVESVACFGNAVTGPGLMR
ncbi:hypothetical protein COLO4_07939 [Corchorus olitorius]|uniref:Uncharacterized protein n=1 Tax=Corchorus olitorius TaxID=93759 RepID=A0A1R3KI25_9ROSI|nr:hypothetical protein COLO4_07939 [Corchorus olitorius]